MDRCIRSLRTVLVASAEVATALGIASLTQTASGQGGSSTTVQSNAERTSGSFSGRARLFLNEGALRGTYRTTFSIAGGKVAYTGTMKITSGTGDFRGVTGSGTIRGTSSDGLTAAVTEKRTLTFPPVASS